MGLMLYILAAEELGILDRTAERYCYLSYKDFSSQELRLILSQNVMFLDVDERLAKLSEANLRNISNFFTRIDFEKSKEFARNCSQAGIRVEPYLGRPLSAYHLISSIWYSKFGMQPMFKIHSDMRDYFQSQARESCLSLGVDNGRPICFLHIRDTPDHHIRNCNPENYSDGIDYLISKGYTVYRSGFGRQIRTRPHLIQRNSQWANGSDIAMLLASSLAVTCQSGPSYLASIFQKPNLVLNIASPVVGLMVHDHPMTAISIRRNSDQEQNPEEILRSLVEYVDWADSRFARNRDMDQLSKVLIKNYGLHFGIGYANVVGGLAEVSNTLSRNPLLRKDISLCNYSLH